MYRTPRALSASKCSLTCKTSIRGCSKKGNAAKVLNSRLARSPLHLASFLLSTQLRA